MTFFSYYDFLGDPTGELQSYGPGVSFGFAARQWFDTLIQLNELPDAGLTLTSEDLIVNEAATVGTEGDDLIIGTMDANVIEGGAGNDVIYGDGGPDGGVEAALAELELVGRNLSVTEPVTEILHMDEGF